MSLLCSDLRLRDRATPRCTPSRRTTRAPTSRFEVDYDEEFQIQNQYSTCNNTLVDQRVRGVLVVITGHGPQAEVAQVFGHELLVDSGEGRLEGLEEEQRKGEEKEIGEENNHHTTHR